ncbi:S24 family peptidase [Sphingomonas jatrophae]|uniref:Peptidase S24-like n=1 Tax=Sphingomonas jatrophae TaxID=1166337 RepID=A0A1I6K7C7_9SPHN|nr:S24 family peptidase [Sphingomonas jatrophae]SFR87131.1 Peptidase S24-like [Sphingomonas jatrophae]
MEDDAARAALDAHRIARGHDYAALSRVVGRNAAYIQQYIKRGSPRRLAERDRRLLAAFLGVPDAALGGPEPAPAPDLVTLPRLSVAASAGPGALGEEHAIGRIALDAAWLRQLAPHGTADLALLSVEGDSMEPTLHDGDEIIVDAAATRRPLADGIWVLRHDDALLVKRLARAAAGGIVIISDNRAYPPSGPHPPAALRLIGRVIWSGGRVR